MLHLSKCVLCNKRNSYYDDKLEVDPSNSEIVEDLLKKLNEYLKKDGVEVPTFDTVSPRSKVPELT